MYFPKKKVYPFTTSSYPHSTYPNQHRLQNSQQRSVIMDHKTIDVNSLRLIDPILYRRLYNQHH